MAARKLFSELGYERATMRRIASDAELTVGALFNHVTDKRDLIYLIFNDEVDKVVDAALKAPRPDQSLPSKILAVTRPYFRLFAVDPVLSRILLAEVVVESPGLHLDRYKQSKNRLTEGLEQLVVDAQRTGEIRSTEKPRLIAQLLFFTLGSTLRWWLSSSQESNWRAGHEEFARLLHLQRNGWGDAAGNPIELR